MNKFDIVAHIKRGKAIMEKEKSQKPWLDCGPMKRSFVNTNVVRSTVAAGFSHCPHKRAAKDNTSMHTKYAMG